MVDTTHTPSILWANGCQRPSPPTTPAAALKVPMATTAPATRARSPLSEAPASATEGGEETEGGGPEGQEGVGTPLP